MLFARILIILTSLMTVIALVSGASANLVVVFAGLTVIAFLLRWEAKRNAVSD